MPKVSAHVGMTLKISKGSEYEFIRGDIEVSEIDTEKDIKTQLENSLEALNETSVWVKERLTLPKLSRYQPAYRL